MYSISLTWKEQPSRMRISIWTSKQKRVWILFLLHEKWLVESILHVKPKLNFQTKKDCVDSISLTQQVVRRIYLACEIKSEPQYKKPGRFLIPSESVYSISITQEVVGRIYLACEIKSETQAEAQNKKSVWILFLARGKWLEIWFSTTQNGWVFSHA